MGKKKEVTEKRSRGQPTAYKPEYCQMLIDHMKQGYSFESFGPIIGHHRDTLYNWVELFPLFSDAKKLAKDNCQFFWENLGIQGIKGELLSFSTSGWIFSMKNRFQWIDEKNLKQDSKVEVSADVTVHNPELKKYVDFLSRTINPKLNKGS